MSTPLESLLQQLSLAADALGRGDAAGAAARVEDAVKACRDAEVSGVPPRGPALAEAAGFHQQCEALAAALQKLLADGVEQSATSAKAQDAYRKAASGG